MSNKRNPMMCLTMMAAFLIGTFGLAKADFTFGDVEPLPEPINTPSIISGDFTMTADGLEAYFVSINRPGGYGREDIWVCRRQSTEDSWGPAENLGPNVNTSVCDSQPCISADGTELYFSDVSPWGTPARPGGYGGGDIWVTWRANRDDEWLVPVNIGAPVNTGGMETYPNISADGLSLYFSNGDLYVATRPTRDDNWSARVRVTGGVNSGSWEGFPNISADQRVLLFYSDRPGGYGGMDIYMAMRPTVSDTWGPAVNLGPMINTPYYDMSPSLSVDGCTLHFTHNDTNGWGGNYKICRTTISPVIDLNGDGIVNATDMCIMVDHWGTDELLCDIGPMPWGDGIVDVQDLILLSEHLFENYRLVAHWALDEIEGDIAYDSAGDNPGILNGNPIWQPAGGLYDGALEFDGNDDYVSTPFVLNPKEEPFSVFTWIKGGAPGQVIISQSNTTGARDAIPGSTWLGINPSDGKLMTEFSAMYFGALVSEIVITDGQWHHVGFVYDVDSLHRRLYVDGVQIAEDATVVSGMPSDGGLYIGASKDFEAGTFFSGLIDDVRIYDRALNSEEITALAR